MDLKQAAGWVMRTGIWKNGDGPYPHLIGMPRKSDGLWGSAGEIGLEIQNLIYQWDIYDS